MNRIQRRRMKGWRLPEDVVYVGRPTKWGNPFKAADMSGPENAVESYRWWLMFGSQGKSIARAAKEELSGRTLCCWCSLSKPCHADVLAEAAAGNLWRDWQIIELGTREHGTRERLVHVRNSDTGFIATIHWPPERRSYTGDYFLAPGIGVIGTYGTREAAIDAARNMLVMSGTERLCTPAEIDRVRRDNRRAMQVTP